MKSGKILILGSSNMDVVVEVDHMPSAGETIMASSKVLIPGGKGANQAYAAAILGGDAIFLGMIGSDDDGKALIENLKNVGVDTSHMDVTGLLPSGSTFLMVNKEGNNSIIVIPGANTLCTEDYIMRHEQALSDCDIFMTQMEIPETCVHSTIIRAKKAGKITILDPAPAPESIPDKVLKAVDYLTPNETELEHLTNIPANSIEAIKRGAKILLEKGVGNVLVTMGANGSLLVNSEGIRHFPSPKVNAVDSTAAGDTFNAAFAVSLSEGNSVEDSISFASHAAALSVCKKGAQISIPTRKETETFINKINY